MDVVKVVSYLSKKENRHETLEDIKGVNNMTGQRYPLVQVPTTAGTGSEVTMISVVSSGPTGKYGIVGP
jgi:alcohol dehydrogenase